MSELKLNINGIVVEKSDPFFEMWFGIPDNTIYPAENFLEATSILKEGDVLNVDVDTDGGSCDAGIRIYNACKDLQRQGVIVNTFNRGKQHSIGNVIVLGGQKREGYKSSIGLVHLPYLGTEAFWTQAGYNANELEAIAQDLRREESRILQIYADETGKPFEELKNLMSEERTLTAQELKEWGFLTNIVDETTSVAQNRKPFAYVNLKTNKMADEKEVKGLLDEINQGIKGIANLFKSKHVNLEFTGSDGKKLTLTKETGEVMVGDEATVDGQPDGEVILEDGRTVVVKGGKVESISEPVDEAENLRNQLAEKDQQIADLTEQLNAANAKSGELENKFTELSGKVNKLSNMVTDFVPNGRNTNSAGVKKLADGRADFEEISKVLSNKK